MPAKKETKKGSFEKDVGRLKSDLPVSAEAGISEFSKSQKNDQRSNQGLDLKRARSVVLEEMVKTKQTQGERQKKKVWPVLSNKPNSKTDGLKAKPKDQPVVGPAKKMVDQQFHLGRVIFNSTLVAFLLLIAGYFYLAYYAKCQGEIIDGVARFLNLPAAYVNGQPIKLAVFNSDLQVMQRYFTRSNANLSDQQLRQETMETLVKLQVIKQIAEEKNILVTDNEFSYRLKDILVTKDDQQRAESLTNDLYGWDFNTFAEKVLRPLILTQKVEKNFYGENGEQRIIQQLNDIRDLLVDDLGGFSKIATDINQDLSRETGGDLGWLKLGETAPEFELQLLQLNPGELSSVFSTRFGYHLILLEEKMNDKEGRPIYHVKQIFIKRPSFDDYLQEQIKKSDILTLVRV